MWNKHLLTFLLFLCFSISGFAQVILEDFESTAKLPWNGADGKYNGAVDNPDTKGINKSAKVGSYTKSQEHEYSLFIADLGTTALDLSKNNRYTIQIYSPSNVEFLLKLEGGGKAIEAKRTIAQTNTWVEYSFDFSSVKDVTTLTKVILFFAPGVKDNGDTFLFDNFVANPSNDCAGVVANTLVVDDFECQRNGAYAAGGDVLTVVDNPDKTGINTSVKVGKYIDPLDEWSAIVHYSYTPFDLKTNNNVSLKVWAPKKGKILVKLEGGASAAKEIFLDVTETNKWVTYVADFSGQSVANHKKLAIFMNAGALATEGDVYYVDDIQFGPKPAAPPLEDFEPQRLAWAPLSGDAALHGTLTIVDNPAKNDVNTSAKVGAYKKGTAASAVLTTALPAGFKLTSPQINVSVLAPQGATKVRLQLVSAISGIKERTVEVKTTGTWADLAFDFTDDKDITDFEQMNLLFDPGVANTNTYYFDNVRLGASTVDPCLGVVAIANKLDDFECQRNVKYTAGDDKTEVVANPDVVQLNGSIKVGKYTDPTDEWSALVLDFGKPIDLSVFNQFFIKIWSSAKVPLLFKLEGGTSPAKEILVPVTTEKAWVQYAVDFSPYATGNYQKLAIFFNAGVTHTTTDVYYIDDLEWRRAAIKGCAIDFDNAATTFNFTYFGAVKLDAQKAEIADNPNKSGINTSAKVMKFVKETKAQDWQGCYTDLGAPMSFSDGKIIKVKVLMDHIGNVGMKVEASQSGKDGLELKVPNTKPGQWEEITFDFSGAKGDDYTRLTTFIDLGIPATSADVTSYMDDFVISKGACGTGTAIFEVEAEALRIFPNPVAQTLMIENAYDLQRIEIFNTLGQRLQVTQVADNGLNITIDVQHLQSGVYYLAGYNKKGFIANSKFVKE